MARLGLTLRLLVLLAAAILPAMAALLYVQIGLRRERSDRAAEAVMHQAELLSAEVETLIDGARQLSLSVAQFDSTRSLSGGCQDQLRALRGSLNAYALLQVVRADGTVVCSTGRDGGAALRDQVVRATAGKRFMVGRYTAVPGAGPMLPMILPFAAADRWQGAVVAAIDLGWLQQRMLRFRSTAANSINVSDDNGTILVRLPDPQRWVGHAVAPDARDLIHAAQSGTRVVVGLDGIARMVGYVPVPQTGGLYVAYGVYVPDLLAGIDRAAQRGYVLIAVWAALSLALMTLVTRRLVHAPTEVLLKAAQRWSRGDLAARADLAPSNGDEFSRLAAAFNGMAEALDARQQQLRQLNVSLEERVGDRTRALSETNNRLLVEINERERTDAALRQAQKLQAVGHLAGGMAHEFNNMLTTVMGALELLRVRLGEGHALLRYIGPALEAAQRGGRLTSQLLAFARRRRLVPVAVDLNAVIREMRELLEGTVGRSVSVEIELEPCLWPALADRHEIEAAILNLVLNARDAMAETAARRGTLRLATRNTVLPSSNLPGAVQENFVELLVEDDGAGMTEDELAYAIDPFFTTKGPGQGAGLGLSQVHGIAQQLGGDLQIASVKGRGTTVSLCLPRAPMAADDDTPPVASRAHACGPVLLVDDDTQVRQVAADMLRELGYDVTAAPDGAAAIQVMRERGPARPFAILIADYAMPGLSGIEVIGQARALQAGIVTLLITGYMDFEGAADPDLLEPRQILRKPFTLRELAERIGQLAPGPPMPVM